MSPRLRLVSTMLRSASAYIVEHHRHHAPARGCISVVAVAEGERWHRPRCGRTRADQHPTEQKLRWEIVADAGSERR